MKNRVPMWLPILTNYLWQCRGNLRQYLTIVDQISKTSLSDSLTESPTWIQEMLAHLKSISWGKISECSVLDGLGWARSECRGAWELERLLLYVLVLKSARYMGYKSEKWTPLNIYILYMICKLRSFHISPPNTQQLFLTSQNEKKVLVLATPLLGVKMATKVFVRRVFAIFATNASFLRVIANLQIQFSIICNNNAENVLVAHLT